MASLATSSLAFALASVALASPVAAAPHGRQGSQAARPDPRTRAFRTVIARERRQAPDFAGHYVLLRVGCGAECLMLAAVDVRSPAVVWLPWTVCCWPDEIEDPVVATVGSDVMEVTGMLDEAGPKATRRYRLVGRRFVEID